LKFCCDIENLDIHRFAQTTGTSRFPVKIAQDLFLPPINIPLVILPWRCFHGIVFNMLGGQSSHLGNLE
jgi:hypothetical protein